MVVLILELEVVRLCWTMLVVLGMSRLYLIVFIVLLTIVYILKTLECPVEVQVVMTVMLDW